MPRAKKPHLKQRKDGRYACRYKDQWFYGDTEDEALAEREAYKRQESSGQIRVKREPTVREYAPQWLSVHKSGVSQKCYNDYAKQLEALFPIIGHKTFSQVTVDDAALIWNHFDGYSASTIKRAKILYIALFDTAIENDLCRKNPFRSKFAQAPKGTSGTHRVLTDEEINLILSVPHRFQLPVLVMLYAGLRRGEVLALTMADVDLKKNMIQVSKAVRYDSNQPIIDTPKTAAGIREVPIFSPLRPFLLHHKGLIAESAKGALMSEIAFKRAWDSYLHALSEAAGHPISFRPHDLRHTYCTMLRDAGVDMKQAMAWMGHADEKMILRIYDHVRETRTFASVSQVERLIRSQNGSQNSDGSRESVAG